MFLLAFLIVSLLKRLVAANLHSFNTVELIYQHTFSNKLHVAFPYCRAHVIVKERIEEK